MDYNTATLEVLNSYLKEVKKSDIVATLESHLINDLNIDSLDVIEMTFIMEEKYKISVEVEQMMMANLMTVAEVAIFLQKNDKTTH
jgi:acyl carrier protein